MIWIYIKWSLGITYYSYTLVDKYLRWKSWSKYLAKVQVQVIGTKYCPVPSSLVQLEALTNRTLAKCWLVLPYQYQILIALELSVYNGCQCLGHFIEIEVGGLSSKWHGSYCNDEHQGRTIETSFPWWAVRPLNLITLSWPGYKTSITLSRPDYDIDLHYLGLAKTSNFYN